MGGGDIAAAAGVYKIEKNDTHVLYNIID